jgi:hypothetical protein
MKSKPFKSPWGIHKTRCALAHNRVERAITPRTRMSHRFFNGRLARFHENWAS